MVLGNLLQTAVVKTVDAGIPRRDGGGRATQEAKAEGRDEGAI